MADLWVSHVKSSGLPVVQTPRLRHGPEQNWGTGTKQTEVLQKSKGDSDTSL